ncbi:hypothetical protein [Lentzea sp. NPDC051838]|uniref:hypothetical protein n=1 Tax=Lentzea sp. NPDC051838 TaxID=3154849 RepID=UPI00342AA7F5
MDLRNKWVVSSGTGDTFTLYVRDALGVSTPTADSIPPLTPHVPRESTTTVDGDEWDRWFAQSLMSTGSQNIPDRWPSGVTEELRDAHAAWRPTPAMPEGRQAFSELLNEIVDGLTTELGHTPLFALTLIEIPVQGGFWRRLNRDIVLVSEQLKYSRAVLAPLESVIRDLAQ